MRVFLSYRRTDVGGHAGRLADGLAQRLGARSLFQDVATVRPGEDFAAAIDRALDDCDALLAVIGPGWLAASGQGGGRRLDEPRDYVRLELARALRRDVRVVPVLVGGAALPAAEDLPDDLQGLVLRQAVVLRDEAWHRDVDGLVRSLRGEPAGPAGGRRLLVPAVAVLVLAGAAAAVWQPWRSEDGSDLPGCAATTGPEWTALVLAAEPSGTATVQDGTLAFRVRSGSWRPLDAGSWQVTLRTQLTNASATAHYHAAYRYEYLSASGRGSPVTCFAALREVVEPRLVGDATVGFRVRCPPTGSLELSVSGDEERRGTLDVTPPTAPDQC